MNGSLRFGTGGMRGPRRAGPNGINRSVLTRTAAGLARWLLDRGDRGKRVMIGRDARHSAEEHCEDVAGVLAGAGFEVLVLPRPLPTPVLAFSVQEWNAAAGVQITASHNHADDSGCKVYLAGGSQVIPPADSEIEESIASAPAPSSIPRQPWWSVLDDEPVRRYITRVARPASRMPRDLRIAATPLHGVGKSTLVEALNASGFSDVHVVAEQSDPDPDFSTVEYPNPEEPGTADALLGLAHERGVDLAIALDPDADRCAIGARQHDGAWRMLDGNEIGVLLGTHIIAELDRTEIPRPVVATTMVSSSMLQAVAEQHCVRFEETQVGFKWLARAGSATNHELVFAYEEALGQAVLPGVVRDKDGISAAVLAADLAQSLKSEGRTLFDLLDELQIQHGVHQTDQVSVRVGDVSRIATMMEKVRADPPAKIADHVVDPVDYLPQVDLLALEGRGIRVLLRPSGTESKLKTYLEVVEPVLEDVGLAEARAQARSRLTTVREHVRTLLSDYP
nr:phospho-sugar mutase [Actinopolyspora biskrensis]